MSDDHPGEVRYLKLERDYLRERIAELVPQDLVDRLVPILAFRLEAILADRLDDILSNRLHGLILFMAARNMTSPFGPTPAKVYALFVEIDRFLGEGVGLPFTAKEIVEAGRTDTSLCAALVNNGVQGARHLGCFFRKWANRPISIRLHDVEEPGFGGYWLERDDVDETWRLDRRRFVVDTTTDVD